MLANTYLDVYTSIFAYNQMEAMVDLLTGTGLAYLPFIAAILRSVADAYGRDARDAVSGLELNIVTMILVLIFCFMPYRGIDTSLSGVRYNIASTDCEMTTNIEGSGSNTRTGYDDVMFDFSGGLSVSQPIGWALVNYLSTSITHVAIKAAGCSNNYEWMLLRLANTRISNEDLRGRVSDFYTNCYKPALARFNDNPPASTSFDRTTAEPWDDIDWIGSRTFSAYAPLGNGEYYNHADSYLMDQGRYGFAADVARRQSDRENGGTANPYCSEVWSGFGQAEGLRILLLEDFALQVDTTGESPYNTFMSSGWQVLTSAPSLTLDQKQDLYLKMVLAADAQNLYRVNDVSLVGGVTSVKSTEASSTLMKVRDLIIGTVGAVGATGDLAQGLIAKFAIKTAGPILLSMAQMVILIASPFLLVLGGFRASTFFSLAISYFALEFINAIWAFGFLFDQRILDVVLSNAQSTDSPLSSVVVMAVGTAQVFILPLVWLGLMGMVGGRALHAMGGATGGAQAQSIGSRGARTGSQMASTASGGAKRLAAR